MSEKKEHKTIEVKEKKNNNTRVWLTVILGVLFVLAVFQSVQAFSLQNTALSLQQEIIQLESGGAVTGTNLAANTGGNESQGLPPGLQNLPDMVGGC
ncbi:MAG: hypothetical protein ABH821_04825 [archaeon]